MSSRFCLECLELVNIIANNKAGLTFFVLQHVTVMLFDNDHASVTIARPEINRKTGKISDIRIGVNFLNLWKRIQIWKGAPRTTKANYIFTKGGISRSISLSGMFTFHHLIPIYIVNMKFCWQKPTKNAYHSAAKQSSFQFSVNSVCEGDLIKFNTNDDDDDNRQRITRRVTPGAYTVRRVSFPVFLERWNWNINAIIAIAISHTPACSAPDSIW